MTHPSDKQDFTSVQFDPGAPGALTGLRVVDLSRVVAGNMLTAFLGDFGADVVKVEPFRGDALRDWKENDISFHWKVYGRNKRSIALDPKTGEGRSILLSLLEKADVFVENFRPGTLEKMGLAPTVLHGINPNLLVARISGFGQTGPYAKLPGFGTLVEGMSGFASKNGFADRAPLLPPLSLADMIAGVYGAAAVLAALHARPAKGGQVIDLSLLEPIFSILGPDAAVYQRTGRVDERVGNRSNRSAPRNIYRCKDGRYVSMAASTQVMAERVLRFVGPPGMADDPRFKTVAGRLAHIEELDSLIGAWFQQRSQTEALAEMRAADVTVGPIFDIADASGDAHFREREIIVNVEDPELGSIAVPNITPRLSKTPGAWRYPAPAIGQHSDEILAELGFSHNQIDAFKRAGAIR